MAELRKLCVNKLDKFLSEDEKVVLLDADLMGSLGSACLLEKYPDRVINCGIMEAQEMSCAAGLKIAGMKPFVHTFTAFASRRCLDQLFLSIYQNAPFVVLASDPGVQAVYNGGTHMSFEDMGIIRGINNSVVLEPTDEYVLNSILDEVYEKNDKFYWIRLTRKEVPTIYNKNEKFEIGKAKVLRKGTDVCIIANGLMVNEALKAYDILLEEDISATVIDMFTLKPIDKDCIIENARDVKLVVTAENHSITNGLGTAVAEVLAENMLPKLVRIGIDNKFGQVGSLDYLKKEYGLIAQNIVEQIKKGLQCSELR